KLTACIFEEDKKTEYALFRASVLKAVLINLDNPVLFGKNQNLTNIIAKLILDLVDTNKIIEIWGVQHVFEIEESVMMSWNSSVPYLNVLNQGAMFEAQDINCKTIDEYDYNFIAIFDKYLNNCQEQLSSDSDSEVISNGTSD
ncbi:6765_t:CDS:2, partial [Gigaspora rosea]